MKSYRLGERLVALRQNGQLRYVLTDHLGSVRRLADAQGRPMAGSEQHFFPFGRVRAGQPVVVPTARNFTGQPLDAPTGLLYYSAGAGYGRYYDPLLGRFIQPDTIVPEPGNPLAYDRYAYALNNPVRYNDPTGHCPECIRDFTRGVIVQIAHDNSWMAPQAQQALAVQPNESVWMTAGRVVGSVASTVQGVVEVTAGGGIAGGGAAACGTGVLCVGGAPAIAAGTTVMAHGGTTAVVGAAGIGKSLSTLLMASGTGSSSSLPTLDDLSKAGAQGDRNLFTKAGRALQKHSNRAGSIYGKPSDQTAAGYNATGQEILDEILTDPNSTIGVYQRRNMGQVIEVRAPDGRGARFTTSGEFITFLEP